VNSIQETINHKMSVKSPLLLKKMYDCHVCQESQCDKLGKQRIWIYLYAGEHFKEGLNP